MRAAVHDRFGPPEVLQIREVPTPAAKRGEVVVAVRAAALNPKDVLIRKGKMWPMSGRGFPRGTGFDFAGEVVEARGGDLRAGDAVFGMLDGFRGGTVAERLVARPGQMARKPDVVPWVDAAAVPLVGQTALQALRLAKLTAGQTVCVHGASGGLGTMVVQVARALGARVVGVASAKNAELVRALGAEEALDYATGEQRRRRFDVFIDCFGDHPPERVQAGVHVSVIMRLRAIGRELLARAGVGGRARLVVVRSRREDLDQLGRWLVDGTIRAVIDHTVPLERVADGHRAIETKRSRGKVVVTLDASRPT